MRRAAVGLDGLASALRALTALAMWTLGGCAGTPSPEEPPPVLQAAPSAAPTGAASGRTEPVGGPRASSSVAAPASSTVEPVASVAGASDDAASAAGPRLDAALQKRFDDGTLTQHELQPVWLHDIAPRYRSPVLDGPARPSRLAPGSYACRTDTGYNLRPCTVTKDERGFTWIDMPHSLHSFRGVVYDDHGELVIDGTSSEQRPWGCFSCQERCTIEADACGCTELLVGGSRECMMQPIIGRLRGAGSSFNGTLKHANYYNRYEGEGTARHVVGWEPKLETYKVTIAPASRAARD